MQQSYRKVALKADTHKSYAETHDSTACKSDSQSAVQYSSEVSLQAINRQPTPSHIYNQSARKINKKINAHW